MQTTFYIGHFEVFQSAPRPSFEATEMRRQHTNFHHHLLPSVLNIVTTAINYYVVVTNNAVIIVRTC